MKTQGQGIVNLDIEQLLEKLNRALSDEWLAYYQYWIGAKVVKGPMKDAVITELLEHAADELRHAEMLVGRIMQLGGTPVLHPQEWHKLTNCGYAAPTDHFVKTVVDQNIEGEQCAIKAYSNLIEMTKDKDLVTYNIVVEILRDEVEHEDDLLSLHEDLELMMKR